MLIIQKTKAKKISYLFNSKLIENEILLKFLKNKIKKYNKLVRKKPLN